MHLLNTDVLYEKLSENNVPVRFHREGLGQECLHFRYLSEEEEEDPYCLYICPSEEHLTAKTSAAIYCGPWNEEELPAETEYFLCGDISERQLVNLLGRIFEECTGIEERIRLAQTSASPLFEICEAAVDYFHADCYLHDEHFFLRAYDRRAGIDAKPEFIYSGQYKSYMQAPAILDELRVNPEYRRTFKTKGPQLWVDSLTGNRCVYENQFHLDLYLGRFIIQLDNLTPGIANAVEFFSTALRGSISQEMVFGNSPADPISYLIRSFAENENITPKMTTAAASSAGWPLFGRYICGMIRFYKNQVNNYMLFGISASIQDIIPGCRMYSRGNRIYMIINLEVAGLKPADIRMRMSEQIRESLLKAALSDAFQDLSDFPMYMQQANACLDYMNETNMTDWFCEFRQIAIPFWLRKGTNVIPDDAIIAAGLRKLQQYDAENDSFLYKTLEAYIINERSPVITSRVLHIHRSSLPHRLEKIKEITGYNLNSAKTRLHLLMSFALLKEKEGK